MNGFARQRRRVLKLMAGLMAAPQAAARASNEALSVAPFEKVVPGYALRFPHDEGSHPAFRIEWWYVTGWLEDESRNPLGFQITFFRARPDRRIQTPSTFDPQQIIIGHAALADPGFARLMHDERIARAGFGLAGAEVGRTRVWIDDWSLEQQQRGYRGRITSEEFTLDLAFNASRPPLLQGGAGFSRKGPRPESASYYYSLPQLAVSGAVLRKGKTRRVSGSAWLDHEWSSDYMDQRAAGWDWAGLNLDDGSALMLFRMRDATQGKFWAGGTLRLPSGVVRVFDPADVDFTPGRTWRSARTGTVYPVTWRLRAGDLEVALEPLMDDQEYDARNSTGTIYWEGAVRVLRDGVPAGRGYLELTGYWRRLDI